MRVFAGRATVAAATQVVVADLRGLGRGRSGAATGHASDEAQVMAVAALGATLAHALDEVVADGHGLARQARQWQLGLTRVGPGVHAGAVVHLHARRKNAVCGTALPAQRH